MDLRDRSEMGAGVRAPESAARQGSGDRSADRARESADSSRSLPQKSSPSTTKVGAPKMPREAACSVRERSRTLVSGSWASATSVEDRPSDARIDPITRGSEILRSSAKLAE